MQLLYLQLESVLFHSLHKSQKNLSFHKQQVDDRDYLIMTSGTMITTDHTELHTTIILVTITAIMIIIRAMITTTTTQVMTITTITIILRAMSTTLITHMTTIQTPTQIASTMAVTVSH